MHGYAVMFFVTLQAGNGIVFAPYCFTEATRGMLDFYDTDSESTLFLAAVVVAQ